MGKFEELLGKYGKTKEEITFEHEGLSDEELETAFMKAFDDPTDPVEPADPSVEDSDVDSDDQAAADAVVALITALPASPDANDQVAVQAARDAYNGLTEAQQALVASAKVTALEDAEEAVQTDKIAVATRDAKDEVTPKKQNNELTYSVIVSGETKTFSVSLVDKLNALRDLVNNTYSESDDCWYDIDAYDEDKYVIMHDYWRNKHYRQDYSVRNNVFTLKGDRVEVFAQYLTQDEINNLSNMKSNYEQITNELMQYQKKELISSNDYSAIADKEEYIQITSDICDNKNEMTFEELKNTLDTMLLNYAKKGDLNFEEVEHKVEEVEKTKKSIKKVGLMSTGNKGNVKKSRYGNLFKK